MTWRASSPGRLALLGAGVLLGPWTIAVGLSVPCRFMAARSRRAAVTDVTAKADSTKNAPTKK
jgi:hypothetical protein